jgi:hypothetical protein
MTAGEAASDNATTALLGLLEAAAAKAGAPVRYDNLDDAELNISSGRCVVRKEQALIVDSRLPAEAKIRTIARELKNMNLDGVYLPPAVRDILES